MPFNWPININSTSGGIAFDPPELKDVQIGDNIVWYNADDQPHWPMKTGGAKDSLLQEPIPPGTPDEPSSSGAYVPDQSGTISYVDQLDASSPTAKIVVS
jgi:plastocyanin